MRIPDPNPQVVSAAFLAELETWDPDDGASFIISWDDE